MTLRTFPIHLQNFFQFPNWNHVPHVTTFVKADSALGVAWPLTARVPWAVDGMWSSTNLLIKYEHQKSRSWPFKVSIEKPLLSATNCPSALWTGWSYQGQSFLIIQNISSQLSAEVTRVSHRGQRTCWHHPNIPLWSWSLTSNRYYPDLTGSNLAF